METDRHERRASISWASTNTQHGYSTNFLEDLQRTAQENVIDTVTKTLKHERNQFLVCILLSFLATIILVLDIVNFTILDPADNRSWIMWFVSDPYYEYEMNIIHVTAIGYSISLHIFSTGRGLIN